MELHRLPQITYTEFSNTIHAKVMNVNIPIDGTLELTYRCNLRCVHCYCFNDPSKKELSCSEMCRIIDDVARAGCLWLLLSGGEPLSRSDFFDIYMHAKRKGLLITLFTNGTLLDEDMAGRLQKYPPFSIEVSIYGATKETYEKVTGVEGSFEACIKGIRLLLDKKLPLKLKTMAMTLNSHEVFLMKEWARGLGLEFRFDALLHPKLNGSKTPHKFRLSPEDAVKLDVADDLKLNAWRDICRKLIYPGHTDKLFTCGGGKSSFHIDPYGELRPCDMTRTFNYNLRDDSFEEAWGSLVSKVSLQKASRDTECRNCAISPICDQCPGWAFLEKGDLNSVTDHLCKIAKIRAREFGAVNDNTKGGGVI